MSTDLSSLSASNEASLEQLSIYTAWLQNEVEIAKARNQGQWNWKVIERVGSAIPSQPGFLNDRKIVILKEHCNY